MGKNVSCLKGGYFIKIDTQGFEKNVLEGGKMSLEKISGIQIEMSLVKFYESDILFEKMHSHIVGLGFELVGIDPNGYSKLDGRLLQFDAIYFRKS